MTNGFDSLGEEWLPRLEEEMRTVLARQETALSTYSGMLCYHMGWVDRQFRPYASSTGKRLRPLLCLLACAEVGGQPEQALPAAAAIELLHNFSLIHDDIEDGDETRRHRPTVWKVWGIPQGINAGDAMLAMAFSALQRLPKSGVSAHITLAALALFTDTCIALTEGQHLDLDFEQRVQVSVDEYLRMIRGKTASLIGSSVAIGALIGGAEPELERILHRSGRELGFAFQIQDDMLGVWGDPAVTGKAAGNDILRRKKSLPLLHAVNHPQVGPPLRLLLEEPPHESQVPAVLELLEVAGTRQYVKQVLVAHHGAAVAGLRAALGGGTEQSALYQLTMGLLHRRA